MLFEFRHEVILIFGKYPVQPSCLNLRCSFSGFFQSLSCIALSLLLGLMVMFQIMLAAGLPLGQAAWGGEQGKVLPEKYRIASAASSLVLIFSILVVLSETGVINLFGATFSNIYMWVLTVYLGIGIVMNAVSRSKIERLWAPVVAIMFILCLLIQF